MERERLKTLFWPFQENRFEGYYQRFEQRAQTLEKLDLERELQSPTYRHQLGEMFLRAGVGMTIVIGLYKLVESLTEPTSTARIVYLFSLGPQCLATILPSATRSMIVQTEQKILQRELARR